MQRRRWLRAVSQWRGQGSSLGTLPSTFRSCKKNKSEAASPEELSVVLQRQSLRSLWFSDGDEGEAHDCREPSVPVE